MTKKTITLPKPHVLFAKDADLNVSELARKALNDHLNGKRTNIPRRGTRYRDGPTRRTTVEIEMRHADFIDANEVDLSRLVREEIGNRLKDERALRQAEDNPPDWVPKGTRALIDTALRAGCTGETGYNAGLDSIRWYRTGIDPHETARERWNELFISLEVWAGQMERIDSESG